MADLPLNKPAGVLVKTTCVDFPGRLAGSFFLQGCNLRCPYCYNTDLVLGQQTGTKLVTVEELFAHLEKRQGILSGLVISGGEPLLNPYTPLIIKKAKELGYLIKLDTNGTLPQELAATIASGELRPDFIAMDLKTSPDRYTSTLCNKSSSNNKNSELIAKKVKECAEIVASYPSQSREWRTVLVPGLVTKNDISKMAAILPQDASWQFTQFQPGNCIDSVYNEIYPYSDEEAAELVSFAKSLIPGAALR